METGNARIEAFDAIRKTLPNSRKKPTPEAFSENVLRDGNGTWHEMVIFAGIHNFAVDMELVAENIIPSKKKKNKAEICFSRQRRGIHVGRTPRAVIAATGNRILASQPFMKWHGGLGRSPYPTLGPIWESRGC